MNVFMPLDALNFCAILFEACGHSPRNKTLVSSLSEYVYKSVYLMIPFKLGYEMHYKGYILIKISKEKVA